MQQAAPRAAQGAAVACNSSLKIGDEARLPRPARWQRAAPRSPPRARAAR
jgi:hypothetical protein